MGANVGKLLIAVGCIVGGLTIIPFIAEPAPTTALTIGSSVLIGAGVAEIFACLFGKHLWGEKLGIEPLIGLVTTYVSFIAISCVKQLSVVATKLGNQFSNISKDVISASLCAGSAITSTEITNLIEKRPIFAKISSEYFGGLLTYGIDNGFGNFYDKIIGYARKLYQKTTQHMIKIGRLLTITNFLNQWRATQLLMYAPIDFTMNYMTDLSNDLADQLTRRQMVKLDHRGALTVFIGSSVISFSRTGIKYHNEIRRDDQSLYNLVEQEFNIRNIEDQELDEPGSPPSPEILVSRAWNEGARIYSTRNAIETFRSQSERYNYANIAHEFSDGVNQTPKSTINTEYVYTFARSDSNQPVASSSSHVPSINRHILDESRATNDNFGLSHTPQFNWSILRDQSNQDFNELNNPTTVNELNTHLPVKLHPIICWNMDEQKYTFSNPNEWPAFPHKAKVVGFIGTKKSGRTTAIHSLLFELGYYLTEEQLAKSLLPVGVMMYILTKHDLILLDCCDIADSATAKAGNLHSGYLLEFFTYMASCHLVIHTAIPQETEDDQSIFSEQLVNYIHAKAKLQLSWASTIQTHGPSMLTILVRGSKQQCEALDLNKINLFSSRSHNSEDKITFTQGFQDSKAFTWKYVPEEMITTHTLANFSNENLAVSTAILERIKDETEPHGLSVNMQAILAGINESEANNEKLYPFYNGIEANWQHLFTEIMSNSILSQSVADTINYDTIQEADNKTDGLIQEYIDSVHKLVEKSASAGSALATNYKELCQDLKRRLDSERDKPDDEKDPIIGFKMNIEIAKCLLESSKSEINIQTKDNLISWGLHGLTLIHNRSQKTFDHTWMKLCIETYNILDLLDTPIIYNIHWHCWSFLSFASSCGFKLELIKWKILERALYCLKTSANKPRFHFHVLNCLLNFLEVEPYLPIRIHPLTDENNQSSSIHLNEEQYYQLKQMAYYGIAEHSKNCVLEAAEQRQSTNMENYLEKVKNIASKQINILASSASSLSSSATKPSQNESFSALDEHQQFAIISSALERLNTEIALYVSKYIFDGVTYDGHQMINLFSPNSPIEMLQDYHEMVYKYRWLFLQRIASLQDDEYTRKLIEITLPWVVDFLKLPHNEESDSYAVLFVNTLVVAESIMQKRRKTTERNKNRADLSSSRQPITLHDISKKKRKIEDEEEFGEIRTMLLLQKCLKPVLQKLLSGLRSQNSQAYLRSNKVRCYAQYINNLLIAPHNTRIKALSLDLISTYEQNMLRLMTFQVMVLCIKTLWQCHLEKEELASANQLSIIYNLRALLRLLNRIYWITAKNNEFDNIRGPSIIFGLQSHLTSGSGSIHSLPSSDNTLTSEALANEMIQRIGLDNWQNLITLTSIPYGLSNYISTIDPDNSLNFREAVFDVRDEALILLWNLAECSDVSLRGPNGVMTTKNFRSANVYDGFSDTTSFDENGINRVKFLVDHVIVKANTNMIVKVEITTQELRNSFENGKMRAIEAKKLAEISNNAEKQIEEQRLKPNVEAMKEARLKRFGAS